MELSEVTIQDCIEMKEMFSKGVILENGQVVEFVEED